MLRLGIEERGCVAARFQVELPNGVVYFATYFEDEFSEKEIVQNEEINVWSEFPASPGTQQYVVDLLTEIQNGIPAHPDRKMEMLFLDVS